MHELSLGNFHKRFALRILVPVFIAVLAGSAATGAASYYLTRRADEVALGQDTREARAAVARNIVKIATEQETIAIWDDPLLHIGSRTGDAKWLHENIGGWLNSLFGHDTVYILDGSDRPIYGLVEGRQTSPASYAQSAGSLQPFVEAVRGRGNSPANQFERLPGRKPGAAVLTGDRALHATDLALVDGRPAIVSAMLMLPFSHRTVSRPGREPILISVRYLDGTWMKELASQNLIDGARYSSQPSWRAEEAGFALSADGRPVGYLIWQPKRPGTVLSNDLRWVGAGLALTLLLILSLLIRALYRSAMRIFRSELALRQTVFELKASEAQAQHLAFHDVLTGLPNRAMFRDRMDHAIGPATEQSQAALLLLDIDRFKHINDTLGHQAGDSLIKDFAHRLAEAVPPHGTIARLGGDEFAIVIPDVPSAQAVEELCEEILAILRRPFEIAGTHAYVGASIGVALAPDAAMDRSELMRKADIALYQAKADGRDCHRMFASQMDDTLKTRSTIEADLREALSSGGQLELYYQPQVRSSRGPVIGLEALVRWNHPERGLISPDAFVPVAEETGLIVPLGEWVLREACRASKRWNDIFLGVNLSPVQFRTPGFAERIIAIAREEGADPHRLELEITESVLVQNDEMVTQALATLRAEGFRIALDDFGTGYSSLSYLRRFEVDKIKIDRSFVQNLGTVDAGAIITAVVTLGRAMGLEVTAEGVETNDQSAFLSAAGCNVLQGHFFSRALPEEEVAPILKQRRSRAAA